MRVLRIYLLVLSYLLTAITVYTSDFNKPSFLLGAGTTLDVTPSEIEKVYVTSQGALTFPGNPGLMLKASFSYHRDSIMFRLPAVLNITVFSDRRGFLHLDCYAGAGGELYSSSKSSEISPLLTGGIICAIGNIYVDFTITSAYRSDNTDSDIGIVIGLYLQP